MAEKSFSAQLPKVVSVNSGLNQELLKDHRGERNGWFFIGEKQYLLPSRYADEVKNFYYFPVRDDDVWISTFPRSGTTLTQELVWILKNNFDFGTAKKLNLWERSPFFELNLFFNKKTKEMFLEENKDSPDNIKAIEEMSRPGYEILAKIHSPRVIKTHFPLSLLPSEVHKKKAKIIYVARNPKSVLPSYYQLLRLWRTSDYVSSFKKFWNQFRDGHVPWGPFWTHLQEGWEHRNDDNVLFLFYEDMMKDMEGAIKQIATFLSVPVCDEKVKQLKEHLNIKNFCTNPAVNFEIFRDVGVLSKHAQSFVRKGEVREKLEEFNDEIEKEILDWTQENYKTTDMRFP